MYALLRREEIKSYTGSLPFVVFTDRAYYGVFIKKGQRVETLGHLVRLPFSYLPREFRNSYPFVERVINFLRNRGFIYLKLSLDNSKITFDGVLFSRTLDKFIYTKDIGNAMELFDRVLSRNNFSKEACALTLSVIAPEVRERIAEARVIYLETDEKTSKIPFELVSGDADVLVKRLVSVNKKTFQDSFLRKVVILGNSWDERFVYSASEAREVYNAINKRFSVELICNKMKIEEFMECFQGADVFLISSHADANGIDIGEDRVTVSALRSVSRFPKLVFLNTCYFDGIEEMAREMLSGGSNLVIYPGFRLPDSFQTKAFTLMFFESLSRTYDIDLSLFIAMKASKEKNHYNYLLYRICV